jgi:photosystem II stability/assembly factor-like uncharacterized protein
MRTIVTALILLSVWSPAQTFHHLKSPMGVNTSVVSDRNGTVYFGSLTGGVYSSTDSGSSWARISLATLGSTMIHALSFTKDRKLVACTDQGGVRILQKSNTWTSFNAGFPTSTGLNLLPSIRSFTCDSAGHYFAGTRSSNLAPVGLFYAPDTGATWTDISSSLPTKEILSLITSPAGTVYCGTDGFGVYTYNGSTWTAENTGLSDLHPHTFAFDAEGNLFAGTNAGISVLKKNATSWINYAVGNAPVLSLAFDPTDMRRVVAGLGFTQYQEGPLQGWIYISTDTGKTWSDAAPSLKTLRMRSVAFAPNGWIYGAARGTFRSTDHGATWTTVNNGYKDVVPAIVASGFTVTPKKTFITGSEYGLYRSTDQGLTWNDANTGIRFPLIEFVFCDSLGYLFACAHGLPRHDSSVNKLYRSTDDGLTWDTVNVSRTGIYSMIAQGFNNELYLAHGFGAQPPSATIIGSSCAKSTDRGATWFDLPCLGGGKGFAVGVTKQGTVLFGGETLGLFRSTDGGASWDTTIHVGPGGNMAPVAVSPRGDIFTCTYGDRHLWFSDSASDGRSYTNMISPSFPMYTSASSFQWSSTGRMYVGLKGNPPNTGMYYVDGPVTANSTFTPVPGLYFNVSQMRWDDDGYMWIYGSGALAKSDSVLTAPKKTTGVIRTEHHPEVFTLEQNYPNPFNPTTTITFTVAHRGITTLKVYDMLGREAAVLVDGPLEPGIRHVRTFDASRLTSGVYRARLVNGGSVKVRSMLLIK